MTDTEKPICFVISPIGPENSEIRKWANQTFKHLIEPVAERFGFSALRADKEARAGIITTHVIQRLVTADLVVADLTNRNPNVFYELAVRHVTRKPLVQIIREDEDIPFDVQGMRTVKFQLADPDILEVAREELTRHVEAGKDERELDTPISQAVDLQIAMESGDPNQVKLAEIASSLQDLTAEVRARPRAIEDVPIMRFSPTVTKGEFENSPFISPAMREFVTDVEESEVKRPRKKPPPKKKPRKPKDS